MRKFYSFFKLYVAAALLITFAGKANAEETTDKQLTANDLVGTYSFTADFDLDNSNELSELLTGSFTFEIVKDGQGYYAVKGFAIENQQTYFSFEGGAIMFNSAELSYGTLDFADANGSYPYGSPMYYPTWNVDSEGNITIPDFTVVTCDYQNSSATIVAKYSNCQVTKIAGEDPKEDEETVNFAGTYTVKGAKYDYSNGMPPAIDNEATFTLSIDDDGIVTNIAGYDVTELANWGYVIKGKVEGSKYIISVDGAALTLGQEYDVLGDGNSAWSGSYDSEGTIELSLKDGKYSITDFTIWSCTWNSENNENEYKFKCWWTGMEVTKEGGEEPIEPTIDFVGTYTVTGTKVDYTGEVITSGTESFTLSIDEDGNVYEIAGYKVPGVEGYGQYVYGKVNGNTFVMSPTGYMYLTLGETYDVLGDGSYAEEYDSTSSISLKYVDGTWEMDAFSVWEGYKGQYTRKYYWTGLTVTKVSDEVSISSIAPAAAVKADGKFFENGKIVIIRNGVKYNTNGVIIK